MKAEGVLDGPRKNPYNQGQFSPRDVRTWSSVGSDYPKRNQA
jgi:hypothetical protein